MKTAKKHATVKQENSFGHLFPTLDPFIFIIPRFFFLAFGALVLYFHAWIAWIFDINFMCCEPAEDRPESIASCELNKEFSSCL